jgi:hypothetical protein
MSIPDATGALVAVLKAEPTIAALVAGRVFGQSLPAKEATNMPRAAIIVQNTGGSGGLYGLSKLLTQQVDIRSYGRTSYEANQVALTVYVFLNGLLRGLSSQTLIYSCRNLVKPFYGEESDDLWPFSTTVWEVNSSLQPVV